MDEIKAGSTIRLDPIQCFTSNRIDMIFKLIYGESIKHNSRATYPREVYKKHLFSITGGTGKFVEHGNNPPKAGFTEFDETFKSLINGNVKVFPPVRVDLNLHLNNGSHRVVAGYLQDKEISAEVDEKPRGIKADYRFFKKANRWRYRLNEENLDYALLRLAKINPRIQFLVVYPSMRNKVLLAELRNHENFFLERSFRLNPIAKSKLLQFLYPEPENFINLNPQNSHNAFRDRFNTPGKLRIFFFENNEYPFLSRLKHDMRNRYRLPSGSIHTPDSFTEAIHLLEVLLIKNSRKNLHSFNLKCAHELRHSWAELQNSPVEREIVGSYALALLGMRHARDLDLIFHSGNKIDPTERYDVHNLYWEDKGFNVDELIVNPRNFMCIYGIKIVSIENLFRFKLLRHELKDLRDLLLILSHRFKSKFSSIDTLKHFVIGHLRILRNLSRMLAK
jgi:hypothetical protein